MSLFQKLSQRIRGPKCRVTAEEKEWLEKRFLWLSEQFGPRPVAQWPELRSSRLQNCCPKNGTDQTRQERIYSAAFAGSCIILMIRRISSRPLEKPESPFMRRKKPRLYN